jgi:hypothetical protein
MDQNQLLVRRLPGLEIPVNHLGLLLPHDRDVDAPAVRDVDAPAQNFNVFWIPKTFQRFLDVEGEFHTPKQT